MMWRRHDDDAGTTGWFGAGGGGSIWGCRDDGVDVEMTGMMW